MVLIVEDGTGLATAESLITVAEADDYFTKRGTTAWTSISVEGDKETALRRASQFLTFSFQWAGYPSNGRTQALAWPRYVVEDREGYTIGSTEIPREVKNATAELALYEYSNPQALNPVFTPSKQQSEVQVGPIRVKFNVPRSDAASARPILVGVLDLIGEFLDKSGGNRLSGPALRV